MRTQLVCALAVLSGAEIASAQTYPAYPNNGYYQGYGQGYQMSPQSSGYYGYSQYGRQAGYVPYYQGTAGYPNRYTYPTAATGYPNGYSYPTAATGYPNGYSYPAAATGYPNGYYPASYPRSVEAAANTQAVPEQPHAPVAELPAAPNAESSVEVPGPAYAAAPEGEACPVPVPIPQAPVAADGWAPGKDRFWVSAGYMMSFIKPERLATNLVTIGSLADQAAGGVAGALNQPGTIVIFGNNNINFGMFSGIRMEAGFFLDDSNRYSLDVAGEYAFQKSMQFAKTSDALGNPVIGRPFFNVVTGSEAVDQVSNAATGFAGGTSVDARSELFGGEMNGRYHFEPRGHLRADALFGFRYFHLKESLALQDAIQPLFAGALTFTGNPVIPPNTITDQDYFGTRNDHYGLQFGGDITWESDWFFVNWFGKVALGATNQHVDVNGTTTLITPNGNQVAQGGVLALPTNIGSFSQTKFGFLPETGLTVGVHVTPHLQLTAGYSFLYWDQVVRPGLQIDRTVNTTLIPLSGNFGMPLLNMTPPSRPAFSFVEESFWMHNLNLAVDFHY